MYIFEEYGAFNFMSGSPLDSHFQIFGENPAYLLDPEA